MLGAYGAHGLAATGITPFVAGGVPTPPCNTSFPRLALLVLGLCGVRSKVITFAGAVFCAGDPGILRQYLRHGAAWQQGAGAHHRPVASVLCWDGRL